jgi:hypothetical protein
MSGGQEFFFLKKKNEKNFCSFRPVLRALDGQSCAQGLNVFCVPRRGACFSEKTRFL